MIGVFPETALDPSLPAQKRILSVDRELQVLV